MGRTRLNNSIIPLGMVVVMIDDATNHDHTIVIAPDAALEACIASGGAHVGVDESKTTALTMTVDYHESEEAKKNDTKDNEDRDGSHDGGVTVGGHKCRLGAGHQRVDEDGSLAVEVTKDVSEVGWSHGNGVGRSVYDCKLWSELPGSGVKQCRCCQLWGAMERKFRIKLEC